ncbi:PTS transporter subunit EIIC, partial [Robertmurraya sp. DFI.2.37]|uniref:PTS transporter subunit EIIC n=1 Tax=Robertmurraya sp. DFI.2.37 TaxID=3031819 RepID=UPI0023D9EA6E
FWFDVAGINDIGNFRAGKGELGITGRYQAGFFPIMMFGLPAAALAMYHTAKTKRKKQAASLLMAGGIAAYLTGVTEPLDFSFMFLAPALYVVHALLTG